MAKFRKIVSVIIVFSLIGCSAFRSTNQTIKINCNVPEPILKVNGDTCKCPTEVQVRRNAKVIIEAYKDGYDNYHKEIDHHLSTTAKLDIVGTCIIFFPVFGLMFPGAWDLDETDIIVVLNEK